ncbi:aminoglycoside phosphotransferase family protein [Providencia sp. PROV090]|uniref:aminoglycoside phosphotransferase family protein n=1 Tax=Providencia sp. PROV090 TaxID=2949806 RepID=UPI002349E1F1|nr:aminoglycoside phosphotransferase family protein [Providencia sp. PROV090]
MFMPPVFPAHWHVSQPVLIADTFSSLVWKVSLPDGTPAIGHCCKVSDEAAFCLIQRPYISKTLLTRRISPRGSP